MMHINKRQPCPCGSGARLSRCCWPLLQREQRAGTPEQLMRSRYTAYSLGLISYVVETTHPAQQARLDVEGMTEWAQTCRWHQLSVLEADPVSDNQEQAWVEFSARFTTQDNKQLQTHHERSEFRRVDGCWYFVDPNTDL